MCVVSNSSPGERINEQKVKLKTKSKILKTKPLKEKLNNEKNKSKRKLKKVKITK